MSPPTSQTLSIPDLQLSLLHALNPYTPRPSTLGQIIGSLYRLIPILIDHHLRSSSAPSPASSISSSSSSSSTHTTPPTIEPFTENHALASLPHPTLSTTDITTFKTLISLHIYHAPRPPSPPSSPLRHHFRRHSRHLRNTQRSLLTHIQSKLAWVLREGLGAELKRYTEEDNEEMNKGFDRGVSGREWWRVYPKGNMVVECATGDFEGWVKAGVLEVVCKGGV